MEFQFLSSYMRSIYTMKWPSTTIVWLSLLESEEKVKFVENSFISWIYNSSQWKWICRQCCWIILTVSSLCKIDLKVRRSKTNLCQLNFSAENFPFPCVFEPQCKCHFQMAKMIKFKKEKFKRSFLSLMLKWQGGCNWLFQKVAYCSPQTSY